MSMDDDLDALLRDLSSASKPAKQPQPEQANVNMNELDSLINNLSGPSATASVTVTAAPPKQTPAPVMATQPAPVDDDLDNLMNSLSVSSEVKQTQSQPKPKPSSANKEVANADDLDALLGDLSAPAPQQQQPKQKQAQQVDLDSRKAPTAAADSLDDLLNELSTGNPPPKPTTTAAKSTTNAGDSLDDLLGQLSTGNNKNAGQAPVSTANDDLDNLLDNLNTRSTEMGSTVGAAAPSGVCAKCGKPITGQLVTALGKSFHPEHFTCSTCQKMLGTATFYDVGGMPQCEQCFKNLSCPRCGYCDQPILDRYVTALGKKWHPEHFICAQCLQPFATGAFFEREGKPFCETCFYSMYAFRCAACNEVIKGECVTAFGTKWHPEHFNCQYCHEAFVDGAFFEYQGKPYCELHYHQMSGSLCSGCGKAVGSRSLTALGRKWHPEHFVCAFCMNPLAGASFKEGKGKPYCTVCFSKLFGQ